MKKTLCLVLSVLLLLAAFGGCAPNSAEAATEKGKDMRICVIPLVVHPWFYEVYLGSQAQAKAMSEELGYEIKVEYYAPETGELSEQITLIEQVAATNPDGLILCPNEISAYTPLVEEFKSRGISIGLINQRSEWEGVVGCANDLETQGSEVGRLVVEATGGKGKVAVMNGVPGATHGARYAGIMNYLAKYPDIEIVEAGYGQDNFALSSQLAAATIAANPDLALFTCVDATAPTSIANSVREANKVGEIKVIGMETTAEILEAINDGVIQATVSSRADMQGRALLLNVWAAIRGMAPVSFLDTGLDIITKDNVAQFMK